MVGRRLSLVTVVVADYDEAIAFYTERLGFELVEDTVLGHDKRWVVVSPGAASAGLLLARADGEAQQLRIGDQTGGRVGFFVETDDFDREHTAMLARGVRFREAPRREDYGTVAVFEDLYGNLFDLVEPRRRSG
jgi:catechol 2,3-dioxygenase-like lactoylglutathione lyase family enzyme